MPDPNLPDMPRPYSDNDLQLRSAPQRGLMLGLLSGAATGILALGLKALHLSSFPGDTVRMAMGYSAAIGASWGYTEANQHNRIANFLHRYTELEKAGKLTPENLPSLHPQERQAGNYPVDILSSSAYQAAIWTGVGLLLNHGIYKRKPELSNILLDYTLWGSLEGAASGAASAAGQDKKAAIARYFEEKASHTERETARREAASIDGIGPKH